MNCKRKFCNIDADNFVIMIADNCLTVYNKIMSWG